MPESATLKLLLHGNQLKRTTRTGWVQRGITDAEDVAAHTFGATFTALILAKEILVPLDLEKILIMSTLHDLPEGVTTDIPSPAWGYLPTGIKTDVERKAMKEILGDIQYRADLMIYWEELHAKKTNEALLVHDADKLDMYLQAFVYEQHTGNRQLQEFWINPHKFHYHEAQKLFDMLDNLRDQG